MTKTTRTRYRIRVTLGDGRTFYYSNAGLTPARVHAATFKSHDAVTFAAQCLADNMTARGESATVEIL